MNGGLVSVTLLLPGIKQKLHGLNGGNALFETLAHQDGEFKLSHVEPTAVLGREMKLEPASNTMSFNWVKDIIQGTQRVSVEIIKHQPDHLGIREMDISQFFEPVGKVGSGAPLGQLEVSPALQGLKGNKQIAGSFAFVFVVDPTRASGLHWQRLKDITQQLARTLIGTDQGTFRVKGFSVQVERFFHMVDKLAAYFRDAPAFLLPGLKFVFLSVWRMVS
jgi:hypothetical protein